jgi:AraC-like DNA-binding protein
MPAPAVDPLSLPASYALVLVQWLRERGQPVDDWLREAGLDPSRLQGQHAQVAGWQYGALLARAHASAAGHGLAYELGLRSQVTRHGFVGFGLISCASLREAIAFSERYFQARVPAFAHALRIEGDQAVVSLRAAVPLGPLHDLVMDMVAVELCTLFAKVRGADPAHHGWTSEIHVPHAEPDDFAAYRTRLPRWHFGQPEVQIRFPAALLDAPILTGDPVSMQLATERCEQELARRADAAHAVEGADVARAAPTWRAQVQARLVCRDGRYPSLDEVASDLCVAARTLKRRLQDEGCHFQLLLEAARREDAQRLLRQPGLAVQQVADALGYTDPANFARAFSRWTGQTPSAWRRQFGLN